MINYKNRLFTLIVPFIFLSIKVNAQEFNVVDNKGTINSIFKNKVTTGSSPHLNPIEGDVWFNDTDGKITIWDGTNWKKLSDSNNITTNIYNANGSLTNHRVLTGSTGTGGRYDLSFNDIGNFTVNTTVTEILSSGETKIGSSGANTTIKANNTIVLNTNTSVAKNLTVDENFQVKKQFIDAGNNAGTAGQILASTGIGTDWIDNLATKTIYTDNGTITGDRTITGDSNNRLNIELFKGLFIYNTDFIDLRATESINLQATNGIDFRSNTIANKNFQVKEQFLDKDGDAGTTGQILASTNTGTDWIDNSAIITGTTGSIFFAGAVGKPTENNTQLSWDDINKKLYVGNPFNISDTNKLTVNGTARAIRFRSSNGTVGNPAFKFSDDNNTGMYRIGEDNLGFSTNGTNALAIDATQNISIPKNLSVTGTYADTNGDAGTTGQILSSTATGTDWIDNPALNNWLTTGNSGTTTINFLGTTDDKKMQIRSNNIPLLEFGRRQTLGLTQSYPDYTDDNQSVVHIRGNNGVSALQFESSGANFYKPIFFTTSNGSFRLKGASGKTDFFEIGSAGPDNQGRLEFVIGDDGDEPIVFKRYDYRGAQFHRELFRVQGSNDTQNAKTRFGINLNQQEVPISSNLNANYNDASFKKANSTFQVVGSVSKSITSTNSNFTLTEDNYTLILKNNTATNITITIPDASTVEGRIYIIKTSASGFATLSRNYVSSNSTTTLGLTNATVYHLQSDGTTWQQIN
ncbi:hypothetical protein [Tenacibaculum piscium]|uniref:hypothetical protein n=1 Tax=Tenacibaculum piscium TaxID=1458515 RepID=UPI001F1C48BA|nr:hypothetical protein [Tenacibaculum piscium]